jgi:hypothetical protein
MPKMTRFLSQSIGGRPLARLLAVNLFIVPRHDWLPPPDPTVLASAT